MASPVLIADDQTVYRGMRNSNWCKHGIVSYRAFMLRPANEKFPAEEELSLGLSPAKAVEELQEHHGVGGLSVGKVHHLPHGLTVRTDPQDEEKAEMLGLPLFSTDPQQRDLALAIATDLAKLAHFIAPSTSKPSTHSWDNSP